MQRGPEGGGRAASLTCISSPAQRPEVSRGATLDIRRASPHGPATSAGGEQRSGQLQADPPIGAQPRGGQQGLCGATELWVSCDPGGLAVSPHSAPPRWAPSRPSARRGLP